MFIGLDFETSGTVPEDHAPIQIGMATLSPDSFFVRDIGGWNWSDLPWTRDFTGGKLAMWDQEAFEVHGIDRERLSLAPSVEIIDGWAANWVGTVAADTPRNWRNVVGWNVAGFDLAFLRRHMPKTSKTLSYRTVDLNAVVFSITGNDRDFYNEVKSEAKDYAAGFIAEMHPSHVETTWHDAGYDALAALYSFEYLHDNFTRPQGEMWP